MDNSSAHICRPCSEFMQKVECSFLNHLILFLILNNILPICYLQITMMTLIFVINSLTNTTSALKFLDVPRQDDTQERIDGIIKSSFSSNLWSTIRDTWKNKLFMWWFSAFGKNLSYFPYQRIPLKALQARGKHLTVSALFSEWQSCWFSPHASWRMNKPHARRLCSAWERIRKISCCFSMRNLFTC